MWRIERAAGTIRKMRASGMGFSAAAGSRRRVSGQEAGMFSCPLAPVRSDGGASNIPHLGDVAPYGRLYGFYCANPVSEDIGGGREGWCGGAVMEEALRESRERFESAFEYAAIGMGLVAPDGRWIRVNRALCKTLGYLEEDLLSRTVQSITHPDDLDASLEQGERLLRGELEAYRAEQRYFRKDGRNVWALLNVSAVHGEDGEVLYFIAQVQDITERKALEEELARMAYYDSLTGLPNRTLLEERIRHALDRSRRTESPVAILYLDLDGFKEVNDSLGHEAGDRLLIEFARRLELHSRPTDTVARLGGDEFCVLLEDFSGPERAASVADRLRKHLTEPFEVFGARVRVGVSIGIAAKGTRGENQTARQLLCEADAEMYRDKKTTRSRAGKDVIRRKRGLARGRSFDW